MYTKSPRHVTFILFDGIHNSVFHSQVLTPLRARLEKNNASSVTLISFEKKIPSVQEQQRLIPPHERLQTNFLRRTPFFGLLSLRPAIWKLRRLLATITSDHIIARGAFAGYIALKAIGRAHNLQHLTIQARGLCAEEYRFMLEHQAKRKGLLPFERLRYHLFNNIEHATYSQKKPRYLREIYSIEAVSPALKEYLVERFDADATKITIARDDIPPAINPATLKKWKASMRAKLNIPSHAIVVCYSGSGKSWQCGKETVEYVAKFYQKNDKVFLLILSQDKQFFSQLLTQSSLPTSNYLVTSIHPDEIIHYLAAGDIGMLLRDNDVVNWVSRPTKLLEYVAAGLEIIHNNTIGLLTEK